MVNIGDKLKAFFKEKCLTQEMIAERFGVSQAYINALLNDKQPFGKKQADRWSREFGISSNWLLTGVGPMLYPVNNQFSEMTQQEIEEISTEAITEELLKLYQTGAIYSAATHDKIVAEKDKILAESENQNRKLRQKIWELERMLEEFKK